MDMEQINTINLWGLRIDEPIVALTDIFIAILCIFFYCRINKMNINTKTYIYFKYYFLCLGVATAISGLFGHAFLYAFSVWWKLPGWITTMLSIMLVERAVIERADLVLRPSLVQIFRIVNIVEFFVFLLFTVTFFDFFFVEFHIGYGLIIVVLSLEAYIYSKMKNKTGTYIMTGIGFAAIAAIVFAKQISLHIWFNHMALSHVFISLAALFFFLGAKKMDTVTYPAAIPARQSLLK